jgi:hypothetical protein
LNGLRYVTAYIDNKNIFFYSIFTLILNGIIEVQYFLWISFGRFISKFLNMFIDEGKKKFLAKQMILEVYYI